MHEYGHTFDSMIFGLSYLFAVAIPSVISASKNKPIDGVLSTHDVFWTEIRANKHAAKYFKKHFEIDWTNFQEEYPL